MLTNGIVAVGFMLITIALYYSLTSLSKTPDLAILTTSLKSDMLTLRRNEKDFLARKHIKYQGKFTKNASSPQPAEIQIENTKALGIPEGDFVDFDEGHQLAS